MGRGNMCFQGDILSKVNIHKLLLLENFMMRSE